MRPLGRLPLRVVENYEILARLFSVADNNAFAGQWPIIHDSHVGDCFATTGIKHVVVNDAFAIQLHVAVWILLEKTAKVLGEFRDFHREMDCRKQ